MSATFPPSYHIKSLREFVSKEKGMRLRVLRGANRQAKLDECDRAMQSIEALEEALNPNLLSSPQGDRR